MDIRIAPSILSADYVNLQHDIERCKNAGADYLHIDVMDGLFVPNITIGIPVTAAIHRVAQLPLDVHLMIDRPIRYISQFMQAGAHFLTIHIESDTVENTAAALSQIRQLGGQAGLSLKPGTPISEIEPLLSLCDLILVMTVEPGFGGQSFMADQIDKLRALHDIISLHFPATLLEVDGGINLDTAVLCRNAGADILVSGSALFHAPDMSEYIAALRG